MSADEMHHTCGICMAKPIDRLVEIPHDVHFYAQPEQSLQDVQLLCRKILTLVDHQKWISQGQSCAKSGQLCLVQDLDGEMFNIPIGGKTCRVESCLGLPEITQLPIGQYNGVQLAI
ncbi:hypothetical protein D3C84_792850 [compost metagenome]